MDFVLWQELAEVINLDPEVSHHLLHLLLGHFPPSDHPKTFVVLPPLPLDHHVFLIWHKELHLHHRLLFTNLDELAEVGRPTKDCSLAHQP